MYKFKNDSIMTEIGCTDNYEINMKLPILNMLLIMAGHAFGAAAEVEVAEQAQIVEAAAAVSDFSIMTFFQCLAWFAAGVAGLVNSYNVIQIIKYRKEDRKKLTQTNTD